MLYEILQVLYVILTAWLAIYGLNAFFLTMRFWRLSDQARPTPAPPAVWPHVTIQLPIYNEKHVITRLLESVSRIEYPRDRLEVQVLDDSTDDTTPLARNLVSKLAARGLDITLVRRSDRTGFKAGALAHSVKFAKGEFVAVFDADFVVPEDFLLKTVPEFQDPGVACVQTRWGYTNAGASPFARALSVALDGHYVIEKTAQYLSGYFINFNGSAGIWRRVAVDAAGGWQSDTLTEDLDLSMRAQMAGWRFVYRPDVVCPSELPFLIEGFRRQQFRWAKGSTQSAFKLLWKVWTARLPFMVKLEASLQLTAYLIHPVMLLTAGFTTALSFSNSDLPRWLPVLSISALGLPTLLMSAQAGNGRPLKTKLFDVLQLILAGSGIASTSVRAVFEAVFGIDSPFLRTPKFASDTGWVKSDYSLRISPAVWAETFTMLVYCATIAATYSRAFWGSLSILLLPLLGQLYLMGLSLVQTRQMQRGAAMTKSGKRRRASDASRRIAAAVPARAFFRESGNGSNGQRAPFANSTGGRDVSKPEPYVVRYPGDRE